MPPGLSDIVLADGSDKSFNPLSVRVYRFKAARQMFALLMKPNKTHRAYDFNDLQISITCREQLITNYKLYLKILRCFTNILREMRNFV